MNLSPSRTGGIYSFGVGPASLREKRRPRLPFWAGFTLRESLLFIVRYNRFLEQRTGTTGREAEWLDV